MDYPGKVITKTQVTPTQTSASGNWTLDDAAAAIKNNNWPVAGVPNPISKSLRFNSADSAYLNRTPGVAGNLRTWTWSGWVKRSALGGAVVRLFNVNDSGSPFLQTSLRFDTDQLRFYNDANSTADVKSSAVYRDASAWYHIVCAIDTTQATSSNRVKLYVNGSQVTALATATYPNQNTDMYVNAARAHQIGSSVTPSQFFDGYLTEVNFIDGQQLTPSSFGMTDPQTGSWEPIKYTGTYGTNGFYLNFKDATSTTTLGYDYSGNNNNWTTNNFSVTAGAGNDSLTDVPTPWVAYNTTGDIGGVVRGNYCTMNPLNATGVTFSNGNLNLVGVQPSGTKGTIGVSSGKWYWETVFTATAVVPSGIGLTNASNSTAPGADANSWGILSNGNKYYNGSSTSYGSAISLNDVIGIAVDLDAGKVWWSLNGTFQASGNPAAGTNEAFSSISGTIFPMVAAAGTDYTCNYNFGQRPFAYTPPAGFLSLNTTNLPNPTIGMATDTQAGKYFNTVLYTGIASSLSVTGVGFQPDFVWIKNRPQNVSHFLTDVLRGAGKRLFSDATSAEADQSTDFTAFNSDGFTVANNNSGCSAAQNYVAWNWKANGAGSSNTAGTITSTVSVNTTSGFSIVSYTGNGTTGATVGHGLGAAPKFLIWKPRASVTDWMVWHIGLSGYNYDVRLNTTTGQTTGADPLNNTAPSSTVITLRNQGDVNGSGTSIICYAFAAVAGYSAFGSYTGNGSTDGPFVFTGFRPRFVIIKRTDVSNDWVILDTARNTFNVMTSSLFPNSASAETSNGFYDLDFLSNGFKVRATNSVVNTNGGTYIYAAFAEFPFKTALAR